MISKSINKRNAGTELVLARTMNRVQDWVKIYCNTTSEAEALRTNFRFMIPITVRCFKSMIKEKAKSRIGIELLSRDSVKSVFISIKWEEIESLLDSYIKFYSDRQDFEECSELNKLKRELIETELVK